MFDIVDTAYSYEGELIVRSFLQDFSKGKGSGLQVICNVHTAFLLCGAEVFVTLALNGIECNQSRQCHT